MEISNTPAQRGLERGLFKRLLGKFRRRARSYALGDVIEESRYQVAIGDEKRTIDNSKSSSSTTRKVRLERGWAREYVIDVERTTDIRGSASFGIHALDMKLEAERVLRQKYSISTEERKVFEEEVTLNVNPYTRSEITFTWTEIREQGFVHFTTERSEVRVPYEITIGLTLDQRQVDTASYDILLYYPAAISGIQYVM